MTHASTHFAFSSRHPKVKGAHIFVPACSVTRTNLLLTHDESKVTCLRCKAYIRRKNNLGAVPGAGVPSEQRIQNQLSNARQRLRGAWERLLNAHRASHDSESASRDLAEGDVRCICGITKAYDTETICPRCMTASHGGIAARGGYPFPPSLTAEQLNSVIPDNSEVKDR